MSALLSGPLYPVRIPGAFRRQRRDRRRKTPKPKEPLFLYFSRAQLLKLYANVQKAIQMSRNTASDRKE